MDSSLSSLVDNLPEINNKKPEDEFIDNFRSMVASLSHSVDNLSEINKKIEKSENKFNDTFRSMQTSLSHLVNDLSEINKKEPVDGFRDQCLLYYYILLITYLWLIIKK